MTTINVFNKESRKIGSVCSSVKITWQEEDITREECIV